MSEIMIKKVLIFGFYGYNNTGDEMILAGMVESLRRRDPFLDITVLSADPAQTEARFSVKAVYAGKRAGGLREVWQAIQETDLFILGGGGLLQDRERRILPFWFSRVGMARALGKKVMFYGLGVGPIATRMGARQVRFFAKLADRISVRDPESAELLRSLGISQPLIHVTADPALAVHSLADRSMAPISADAIGVCLRPWSGWEAKVPVLASALDRVITETGCNIEMLPLHGADDLAVGERVARCMDQSAKVVLTGDSLDPFDLARRIGHMDLVISMRLHGLILAALQHVPYVGISYDPKVKQFMKLTGMEPWAVDFDQVQEDKLAAQTSKAWAVRAENRRVLSRMIPELQKKADQNADLAFELLN